MSDCEGKSAKVQRCVVRRRTLVEKRRAGGPLGKLMRVREDGVYFGHQEATVGEVIVENQSDFWLTTTVRRKTARDRRERSNLELIDAVSWRKNEVSRWMESVIKEKSWRSWRWRNMFQCRRECTKQVKTWRCSNSHRDVAAECRCSWGRRDKRTPKTAEGGLKRS